MGGVACGRCGDWVVSSRSPGSSPMGSIVPSLARVSGRLSGRMTRSVMSWGISGRRAGWYRNGAADAGGAGTVQDVSVELGAEVSHPTRQRKRGQPLVVAQPAVDDVLRQVGQQLRIRRPW